ncbi:MAG TPA: glutaredoxin family protein [Candidatus Marinimicrobia bacterium]|nr:glutaredoxin family protein [Candidatus Neomarinimicrobiota bacterium]
MDKKVKFYALSTCIYCQNTKAFLKSLGIEYDSIDVDLLDKEQKLAVIREIHKLTPTVAFPVIVSGDNVIVGYRPEEIKKALGL